MTILDRIVADKRTEVAALPEREVTADVLSELISKRGGVRPFHEALRSPRFGRLGLIAEVKKASPSAGVICPDFDPVRIARAYESGGASCLSVLTDEKYFQGSLDYLKAIREAVSLPLLRKDFVIDERQLIEAIEYGADAVLLIVAILDDETLARLHRLASRAGSSVESELKVLKDRLESVGQSIGKTFGKAVNKGLEGFGSLLESLRQRMEQHKKEEQRQKDDEQLRNKGQEPTRT